MEKFDTNLNFFIEEIHTIVILTNEGGPNE